MIFYFGIGSHSQNLGLKGRTVAKMSGSGRVKVNLSGILLSRLKPFDNKGTIQNYSDSGVCPTTKSIAKPSDSDRTYSASWLDMKQQTNIKPMSIRIVYVFFQ